MQAQAPQAMSRRPGLRMCTAPLRPRRKRRRGRRSRPELQAQARQRAPRPGKAARGRRHSRCQRRASSRRRRRSGRRRSQASCRCRCRRCISASSSRGCRRRRRRGRCRCCRASASTTISAYSSPASSGGRALRLVGQVLPRSGGCSSSSSSCCCCCFGALHMSAAPLTPPLTCLACPTRRLRAPALPIVSLCPAGAAETATCATPTKSSRSTSTTALWTCRSSATSAWPPHLGGPAPG